MLKYKIGDVVWLKCAIVDVDVDSEYYPYQIASYTDNLSDETMWIGNKAIVAKESEIVYTKSEEFTFGDNVVVTLGSDKIVGKFVAYNTVTGLEVTVLCNDGNVRRYDKEHVNHG